MYFIFAPQKVRFCCSAVQRKVTFSHIARTRTVAAFVRAVAIQELTAADSSRFIGGTEAPKGVTSHLTVQAEGVRHVLSYSVWLRRDGHLRTLHFHVLSVT